MKSTICLLETLRIEARQKLTARRPRSIGQAARIPGVSPGDVAALMIYLEKYRRANTGRTAHARTDAAPAPPPWALHCPTTRRTSS